jgi:hypothetical protein
MPFARRFPLSSYLDRNRITGAKRRFDRLDLGPRVPRSSNAQSPAIYERTILNGPIDVTRPPSYRSGWGRLPKKVSHDEYCTELRPLCVFLSYGGET